MYLHKIILGIIVLGGGFYGIYRIRAHSCPLIPREVLFGNHAKKTQVRISPDGNYLAYLAPVDGVMNIWVKSIDKDDAKPITFDKKRGISMFMWSFDGSQFLYKQDKDGNENWRLYGVKLSDGSIKDYTPYENVQVRIMDYIKQYPTTMLIAMNKRDPKWHDVYELNLLTGELNLIEQDSENVVSWIADSQLKIRGKLESLKEGGFKLYVRKNMQSPWEEVAYWSVQEEVPSFFSFSKDGDYLYAIDSRNSNTSRFIKIDLSNNQVSVLAQDPEYDINGGVFIDEDTFEPLAVSYLKDRRNWIFFDKDLENNYNILKTFDQGEVTIVSHTLDDKKWIIAYTKDIGPVSYWLFDKDSKEGTYLFDHQPIFNNYTLSPMNPISFKSRDGLTIHGYLTYPCGNKKTNLPLVLNVHGGPWVRDLWGFNPEIQWLANRGYAILQLNYRGSTGYGKAFINASKKQWSKAMHDDLIDGVQWAIKEGIADPKRIAIYGGSYGGYAALVGATFTPDIFNCAIDVVGPSNLNTLIKSVPAYWSSMLQLFHERVGNPDTEQEFLYECSPLSKVENIKIPILIAQGANDPRVKQEESEQIVAAMKQKGIPHEYLLFEDEGHGFVRPENKIKFYKHAEKFLADNLGGRYES